MFSSAALIAATCLAGFGLNAHAVTCSALRPHLDSVERGEATTQSKVSVGLGEDYCKMVGSPDVFTGRVECFWSNTEDQHWTEDDARDMGQSLNQSCSFLTAHFDDARHPGAAYFLWYGDFTGVTFKVTDQGMTMVIQIDEEAFYFS